MSRYIDADKSDKALHDLLNMIKQEKETAKNEGERNRMIDVAAGIVLAINALRNEPKVDIWVKTCGYRDRNESAGLFEKSE